MFEKMFVVLVAVVLFLGINSLSFAAVSSVDTEETARPAIEETTEATIQETPTEAIEVGNKICPVSGEEVKVETRATYEYEGKIYNFCCSMCIDAFKNDPQKYIKKVEEGLQAEGSEEKQETNAMPDSMDMHSGQHH